MDAGASIVTVPAVTAYRAGDNVTITGAQLTGASVKVNKVECTIVSNTDTSLVFTYPAVPAGSY